MWKRICKRKERLLEVVRGSDKRISKPGAVLGQSLIPEKAELPE
jgi:hypothetical protein